MSARQEPARQRRTARAPNTWGGAFKVKLQVGYDWHHFFLERDLYFIDNVWMVFLLTSRNACGTWFCQAGFGNHFDFSNTMLRY